MSLFRYWFLFLVGKRIIRIRFKFGLEEEKKSFTLCARSFFLKYILSLIKNLKICDLLSKNNFLFLLDELGEENYYYFFSICEYYKF